MLINLDKSIGLLGRDENIINEKDEKYISEVFQVKFIKKKNDIIRVKNQPLSNYILLNCDKETRNNNIIKAVLNGYRQSELANYIGVSNILISKIVKRYWIKVALFKKLKNKGLFWSYSKEISYEELGDNALCEALLKYTDFDDLIIAFDIFGLKTMKRVWLNELVPDKRFIRLNIFIARVFFSMEIESNYFEEIKSVRSEKLRFLAN